MSIRDSGIELLAEAVLAAEAALRATAKLAAPALERLERAAISGLHIPRSTITLGERLARDLQEAEVREKWLREFGHAEHFRAMQRLPPDPNSPMRTPSCQSRSRAATGSARTDAAPRQATGISPGLNTSLR